MTSFQIGSILRSLREKSGLSAKEVSEVLNKTYNIKMEHGTLYNYEKGRSSPDIDRFLSLCIIYGCKDILYEFGYTNKKISAMHLNNEEFEILDKFQALPASGKDMIRGALGIKKQELPKEKIS